MSKLKLAAKIGMVTTTILLGVSLTGTQISLENKGAISNFLHQKDFEVIESEDKNVDTDYYKSKYANISDLMDDGKKLAEEIESEGAVLLKNENNALPLAIKDKVTLVGVSSVDPAYGGRGSAQAGKPEPPVTPTEGLQNAGLDVNPETTKFYKDNIKKYTRSGRGDLAKIGDAPWADLQAANLDKSIGDWGDVAIFTMTRTGGEGSDFSQTKSDGKEGYLSLSETELSVLRGLTQLKKDGKLKKIILLLNTANQIQTKYIEGVAGVDIDAVMWIGSVGITGFNAIGKLLTGSIAPSGHLSDTYFWDHKLNPVTANFGDFRYSNASDYDIPTSGGKPSNKYDSYMLYQEGIYVGYRYTETRYADAVTKRDKTGAFDYNKVVSYPFGYGMSYTDFEYSNYKATKNGNYFDITVDVKNVGEVAAKDAVQVYVQKPFTQFDIDRKIEKSAIDLVGYAKTSLIQPGETQKVTVKVDEKEFRVYDAEVDKTYILTEGDYYLTAAQDAHHAINNILAAQGKTVADGMTSDGNKKLVEKFSLDYNNHKYSVSEATNNKIENQFEQSDINKYVGKGKKNDVVYLTRTNWEGTFPTKTAELKMTEKMANDLVSQDNESRLKEDNVKYPKYGVKNGLQLIDVRADSEGNPIPYNHPMWEQLLDQLTWEETIHILSNGLRQTIAEPSIGKPGTLDHNGPAGLTEPYGSNDRGLAAKKNDPGKDKTAPYYPCAGLIAATFNVELAKRFGEMLGEDALWAGYSGFYGIAINTHRSAYEGRAYEYVSEDPFLAGTTAATQVKALQAKGCQGYIKHFALNEGETNRNGIQIWLNEQTFREIYLRPFEKAVIDGGATSAMAAFNRVGVEYAPANKNLITNFLRGELGMKGLVVTDMFSIGYNAEHMPTFLLSGTDLPDGEIKADVYNKYKTGYGEFANCMRESAHHVLYHTVQSNAMNGLAAGSKIVSITPPWLTAVYAVDGVIAVLWLISLGGFVYLSVRKH